MSKRNIKDLSYQAKSLMLEVLISGSGEIPDDPTIINLHVLDNKSKLLRNISSTSVINIYDIVMELGTISSALDYPNLTKYRVGDVSITLSDEDGIFSPTNDENIFTELGVPQNGHGANIEIKAGYDSYRTILFKGKVLDATQNSIEGTVDISVTNSLHRMFTEQVRDFGIEKQFKIEAEQEKELNGIYKISDWLLPLSDDSITVKKDINSELEEVIELANRGYLNSDNFVVTDEGIETEGGDIKGAAANYPQVIFKAPYRYKSVKTLISDLLSEVDIENSEIILPKIDLGNHFSSVGRIGYNGVIGTRSVGSGNSISWEGYTTDFIFEGSSPETGKFYFLRNPPRGSLITRASIVEYDVASDTERILYQAPQDQNWTTEFWKIAKNGNDIAVLATDAGFKSPDINYLPDVSIPEDGSYDAGESGDRSYIFFRDATLPAGNSTIETVVTKGNSFECQIGHYYILGRTVGDYRVNDSLGSVVSQQLPNVLPDTRHSFLFHNNYLYYVYVGDNSVGIAKVNNSGNPSLVYSIPRDKDMNRCGLDFDIDSDGNKLIVTGTFKVVGTGDSVDNGNSTIFVQEVNL